MRATSFVDDWCALVGSQGARQLINHKSAHRLIEDREVMLKGKLARLTNASARERWNENSGTAPMDFRWGRTRLIVNDIFDGLNRSADTDGEDADDAPA